MLLLAVAMLMFCTMASAQQDSTTVQRKKVGVVLSGGGAKGVAHIGVLKVLERAGIPIDIITGTSMGSIVGGLYAIGYNSHALDSLVKNQDWMRLISDKENLSRQSLSDRRKEYTYAFSTGMTIGKRNQNDGGLIKGNNLGQLFEKLCTGYNDSLDFSRDLPIPFACVATNIIDNTEHDFHSGRLPQAMRASMAIPAVFSPIRIDGEVLVDGGMRNNYPADLAREMGADIIIGVTLQDARKTAENVWSTSSVLGQIVSMNCKNKYDENLAITDVAIRIDPKGYTAASFQSAALDTLMRWGEEEAMKHWDEIIALKKRIGIDDSFRPTILHPLRPKAMTEKHHVKAFAFRNMTPQDESFLRHKFHLNKVDSIDANLEQEITASMRIDLFYQNAECQLLPMEDGGSEGVRAVFTAGNRKTNEFHASLRYDLEEHAALLLGADFRLNTAVPMNLDINIRLGKRLVTRADLMIHPRSFTRPTLSYEFRRNDIDVYLEGDRSYNILYNQFQAEVTPFNFNLRRFNLQAGLRWDFLHYRNMLGSEAIANRAWEDRPAKLVNEHFFSYRLRIDYNSEDNWYFPKRGGRLHGEYAYLTNNLVQLYERDTDGHVKGRTAGMHDVSANWRYAFSFGKRKRFTLQPMLYGRLLFTDYLPAVFGNTIGGDFFGHYVQQQMPFAGVGNIEYVEKHFVAAQLQAQQHIGNNSYVQLRLTGAQQAPKLSEIFDYKTLLGGQIAYYYNTIIGPIGATLGYSNQTKKVNFYLSLGHEF